MNITARMDKFLPRETMVLLRSIGSLASDNGFTIFLVGGVVRDMLLSRANLDIDIAVDGDGQSFALLVADEMNGSVVMHGRFGTSVVILPGKTRVDIATARTETYKRPGALPDVEFAGIKYDLKRRDFSVNAMAVSLNTPDFGELDDYFGGLADLEGRIIRSLYPESFIDDPTRILRAVRFESALGFTLETETQKRLISAVQGDYLLKVSGARLRKEIFAIAEGPNAAETIRKMSSLGILGALAAALNPGPPVSLAIENMDEAEEALRLELKPGYKRRFAVLTALLMDSGPDAAGEFCGIIELSRFRTARLMLFAAKAAEISNKIAGDIPPSSLYAVLRDISEESLAVLWAVGSGQARNAVREFMGLRRIKPLITGRDLIRWGYPPSKAYAAVLSNVFAKQIDGAVLTKAQAKAEAEKGIIGYNDNS